MVFVFLFPAGQGTEISNIVNLAEYSCGLFESLFCPVLSGFVRFCPVSLTSDRPTIKSKGHQAIVLKEDI